MLRTIRKFFYATAPVRVAWNLVSIVSVLFTLASLLYYGFFDHRDWVTKRVAEQYKAVEAQQLEVLNLIYATVPSRANQDRIPSSEQLQSLQRALLRLSGTVTQVDNVSSEMVEASDSYRQSIASLTGALVGLDPADPSTRASLLRAVDRWDIAARTFADAIEGHIGSFTNTLPSSV